MFENLIVALIVILSAWYAGLKYLPAAWRARLGARKPASGCGSGCDTCGTCADAPSAPAPEDGTRRVIKLHPAPSSQP